MNSTPDQALMALGPRLKLLRRQMQEWKALLVNQRQVRHLVAQQFQPLTTPDMNKRLNRLEHITQGTHRFTRLFLRHAEQCQGLRARHQQEVAELEQTLARHKTD